jgi:membrane protein YqaA with SNARE-associated domain
MRLFGPLYERALVWARHRHAPRYLVALSASESVIFPIPPDVMLAPMAMAQPRAWWRLALLCTLASVVGGVLGYLLGHYALEAIWPWMLTMGWDEPFHRIQALFVRYGFWFVFLAAFTPIPFKVFTISAGAFDISLGVLVAASLFGRGGRFFLVAATIRIFGPAVRHYLERYFEIASLALGVLLIGGFLAIKWLL